jgi:hypothetical protein
MVGGRRALVGYRQRAPLRVRRARALGVNPRAAAEETFRPWPTWVAVRKGTLTSRTNAAERTVESKTLYRTQFDQIRRTL